MLNQQSNPRWQKKTSNKKNQDNSFPPEMINLIIIVPDENDLGEIPDAGLKRMIINMFQQPKGSTNEF